MNKQTRLKQRDHKRKGMEGLQVNYIHNGIQRIETSRGCPNMCPFCYEPDTLEIFKHPEIITKEVQILDMNFLWRDDCRPDSERAVLETLKELEKTKSKFELVCGLDYRFMSLPIAKALKKARFHKIRIAWDWTIKEQYKIKDTILWLHEARYKTKDISCFMLVNWKIPREVCERKLDLLKVWNIKVCDCCYDGGYHHHVPRFWEEKDIKQFRARCRKHNQIVGFKIDPEVKP